MTTLSDELLGIMAQSTDPGIRGLVVRRMELAAEITKIDLLFASMHQLTTADANGLATGELPRSSTGFIPKKEFVTVVRNILLAAGRPLKSKDIYERFKALYPDCAISGPEMLRKRLFVTKDCFRNIEEAGYWPIDYPMPVFRAEKSKKK